MRQNACQAIADDELFYIPIHTGDCLHSRIGSEVIATDKVAGKVNLHTFFRCIKFECIITQLEMS